MLCLGGGGVWCSRTYAYLSDKTATPWYQFQTTAYTGGSYGVSVLTDAKLIGGAALDQGSCCETAINFSTFIGTKSVPLVSALVPDITASAAGIAMVG